MSGGGEMGLLGKFVSMGRSASRNALMAIDRYAP